MHRSDIADLILTRLEQETSSIKQNYQGSKDAIGYFYIDDLLPEDISTDIHRVLPVPGSMKLRKTLREYKYTAAQMDRYNPILEEVIYAFQDQRIVDFIGESCKLGTLYPDEHLYAGGISLMERGHFLNPHLDNSHDKGQLSEGK